MIEIPRRHHEFALRTLRITLVVIGAVQITCGAIYVAFPGVATAMYGVPPGAPAWVDYALATAGARFIGYGVGMFVSARSPWRHRAWIDTMIAIQAVDLVATVGYVAGGVLPPRHSLPTVVLPALYVTVLTWVRLTVLTSRETRTLRRS